MRTRKLERWERKVPISISVSEIELDQLKRLQTLNAYQDYIGRSRIIGYMIDYVVHSHQHEFFEFVTRREAIRRGE